MLPIADDVPIYRERVYCYELYHQMRSRWSKRLENQKRFLMGEVDKHGHRGLKERGAKQITPDFLVHGPGDWNENYAIIEVKPASAAKLKIEEDVTKISNFMTRANYSRGILLIYGTDAKSVAERLLTDYPQCGGPSVEVWIHEKAGSSAKRLGQANALDQSRSYPA